MHHALPALLRDSLTRWYEKRIHMEVAAKLCIVHLAAYARLISAGALEFSWLPMKRQLPDPSSPLPEQKAGQKRQVAKQYLSFQMFLLEQLSQCLSLSLAGGRLGGPLEVKPASNKQGYPERQPETSQRRL